ncbi:MAG: energy-coupling factor transporter ATPase [Tissierellia bacterium]|jgi:energy-coupling factor transport system ATP-binding protein|nr:energy-coupling factor transporter ATPase [Tissierellia bacterium]
MIEIKNLNYIYHPGSPYEKYALRDINLQIRKGEFIGLIGHTGSGKSTFVQHLNGLMKPTLGTVNVSGISTTDADAAKRGLRQKVGLVFQYPEHQLFEETVAKDIAFGPQNLGLSEEETEVRVREAMDMVGLSFEKLHDRSPFELSGGQKRRVAIAGVLAMKPEVLILDEPTAGLDPRGRDEILDEISALYESQGITIILVSHSMEDIARLATRILVLDKGQVVMDGDAREIYREEEALNAIGLDIPDITKAMKQVAEKTGWDIPPNVLTVQEAVDVYLRERKNHA